MIYFNLALIQDNMTVGIQSNITHICIMFFFFLILCACSLPTRGICQRTLLLMLYITCSHCIEITTTGNLNIRTQSPPYFCHCFSPSHFAKEYRFLSLSVHSSSFKTKLQEDQEGWVIIFLLVIMLCSVCLSYSVFFTLLYHSWLIKDHSNLQREDLSR